MLNNKNQIDVLIVGAGPVGLFLANECVRRGLTWRLIEARANQSEHSKALAIFPRTLEIFDMAGVVEPFLEKANRVTSVAIIAHGRTLAHMPFTPAESPYQFIAMVPQNITERLLVEELTRRGGTVEYETSFVSAVEQADGVLAMLDHLGDAVELRASYVVGCDGAHSAVRHLLKLPFEGAQYDDSFILADIETNETLPADELQLCPSELGPVAIFPMSSTRRRIVASMRNTDGDAAANDIESTAPSLDLVQRILKERAPDSIQAYSLHWSSFFRIHHRQVAQLRVGRIFIAGDAAHIHSPFGGQGMNTGLHDAWNLIWKLDLVLRSHGTEELLDSYNAERRPIIKQVIETTHFLTRALGTPSRVAQMLRDAVIPMVSRLAPFQHAFVERLSELGVAYRGSPIIEGPGERFFGDWLRGGNGIRSHFVLLLDANADSTNKAAAVKLSQSFTPALELRNADRVGVALVRPDGYLAYKSEGYDLSAALKSVRSLLERQIIPTRSGAATQRE